MPLWAGGRRNGVMHNERWNVARLDRRAVPRVEYRRTAPALLELEGYRCAVRDLGCGGLRVEPAPAGRVWEGNQQVAGTLQLRTGERFAIGARIGRVDRAGMALFPDGNGWPSSTAIETERTTLLQRHRERRAAPRLPIPTPAAGPLGPGTPLMDVSATGLRYTLSPTESAPATGSRIEGALRVDADTTIEVRGQVVRHNGREIAVAFDPPGLDRELLALLRQRFFPEAVRGTRSR
jgi:PilZ domain